MKKLKLQPLANAKKLSRNELKNIFGGFGSGGDFGNGNDLDDTTPCCFNPVKKSCRQCHKCKYGLTSCYTDDNGNCDIALSMAKSLC